MNHKIVIKKPIITPTASGEKQISAWVEVATVWASMVPQSSMEDEEAGGLVGVLRHKAETHYRSDVTAACRIYWGTRIFELAGPPINVDERNQKMVMVCDEVI